MGLEKRDPLFHIRLTSSESLHRAAHMAAKPGDSTVVKPSEAQVKPPPMFQVVMYNDDYTPMEFVVEVLQLFFALRRERDDRRNALSHLPWRRNRFKGSEIPREDPRRSS